MSCDDSVTIEWPSDVVLERSWPGSDVPVKWPSEDVEVCLDWLELGGGGGPVGTDPESLASLVEYLDARDLSGTLSDGDLVPTWTAAVGGSATQGMTGEQPRWRAAGIGTGPGVDFDGLDDNLAYFPGITSTTHTLMLLVEIDTLSGDQRIVDCQTGRYIVQVQSSGRLRLLTGGGGWRDTGVDLVTGTPYVLAFRCRGGDSECDVWVNRVEQATVTYSPVDYRSTTRLAAGVGADREWLDGKIGLVAGYSRALTDVELEGAYDYIADQWGL